MNKTFLVPTLAAVFFIIPAVAGAAGPTMCTAQYQPVCGAKQVQCITAPCYPMYHTYGNSCTMNAENGTFIHEGECTASETGPVKSTQPYIPPSNCTAWFDGCNSCSRAESGQSMCTERACAGTPAAAPSRCRWRPCDSQRNRKGLELVRGSCGRAYRTVAFHAPTGVGSLRVTRGRLGG